MSTKSDKLQLMIAAIARRARASLDARLRDLQPASKYAVPSAGWVRALRDALGMSAADLGARMGMSAAAVSSIERNEKNQVVRLDTLAKAAKAMNCTLVYAFIPNQSLEETVNKRARRIAEIEINRVNTSMALEEQAIDEDTKEQIIAENAGEIAQSPGLWRTDW